MGSLWAENIQKIDTVATIVDSKVLSDPYLPQHLGGEIFVKAKDANFLNSLGIPVIITNGIGTSRKDIRLFTPSEVVLVILHKY